ncbi:hypothetical protein [Synechococcus sp. CCY 9618]|uniref:hypothetical protein n=1 Tax=Synechococcus sp. CCY 9618 TaxID=2815602 RepID=UPI001C242B31|nr:hypothetical protein [Synechococcus sp. CCY 9618]
MSASVTDGTAWIRRAPLTLEELKILAVGTLPVAVLALGHGLFELVGQTFHEIYSVVIQSPSADLSRHAVTQAGQAWAATALIYLVVGSAALGLLIQQLRSRVRGAAQVPFLALATLLSVLGVGHLVIVDMQRHPLSAIFYLTFESLSRSGLLDVGRLDGVHRVLDVINVMSVVVPASVCAVMPLCILAPPRGWTEASLAARIKDARQLGVVASAFLVAGLLHMFSWMQWSSALLMEKPLEALASSVTLFWSCVFTLMLAAVYIPLLLVLHHRAETVMDQLEVPPRERADWLKQRGLSYDALSQLPQLAAISAPLLANQIGDVLLRTPPLPLAIG